MAGRKRGETKKKETAAPRTATARTRGKARSIGAAPTEHTFDVRDALKVLAGARTHLAALKQRGITDADLKKFDAQIELAKAHEEPPAPVSLDGLRSAVKDHLGDYREAARLVASSIDGLDEKLLGKLRVDQAFPDTDEALAAYLDGIDGVVKRQSAPLGARGFDAAAQAEFVDAARAFRAALAARPDEKAARDEKSGARARIFARLRTMTRYVRRVGRAALRRSALRSDFDRPVPTKRPAKKPPGQGGETPKPPGDK